MPDETVSAWGIIGLANLTNIGRELGSLTDRGRKKIFGEAGRLLLDGQRYPLHKRFRQKLHTAADP